MAPEPAADPDVHHARNPMPVLTPDTVRAATETASRLTDFLRDTPDPEEALALVETLLDQDGASPSSSPTRCGALARSVQYHPDTPHTAEVDLLITELRTTAREQADQHTVHYALDGVRPLFEENSSTKPGGCWCR
ncbi:hypothetical protein [Streptomyces sp. NPDC088725]|uniref:hypothetical protein n=1 Tax=Streptomyces sp. NPDC088725 TaxID=3365873 RepID=UPI00381D8C44